VADLNDKDRMLLAGIHGEFNNQPMAERIRIADFMDAEAVTELLRERSHAMAAVRRIDTRLATILNVIGRRRATGVSVGGGGQVMEGGN
jgi:hypothetical protein